MNNQPDLLEYCMRSSWPSTPASFIDFTRPASDLLGNVDIVSVHNGDDMVLAVTAKLQKNKMHVHGGCVC
jgi:hypothetical protein